MYISRISQPRSKNQIRMIYGKSIADVFAIFIFFLIQEMLSHGSMVYSGLATGLEPLSCFLQQLYGDWCVQGLQYSTYLESQQRQLQVLQGCISGTYQHVSIEIHCIYSHIILFTRGLACLPLVQQIVDLSGSLVKPKTIKLVCVASSSSMQHSEVRAKTGWLRIRIMCLSGATCLSADCRFSQHKLNQHSSLDFYSTAL